MNIETPLAANLNRLWPALTATFSAALLASCAQFGLPKPELSAVAPSVAEETPVEPTPPAAQAEPSKPAPSTKPAASPLYVWKGQGRWVSRIEINVDEQKARFYDGDQEIGWTTIASGLRGYPTPTGKFAVQEKVEEKKSNLYGKIYDRNGRLVRSEAKADVDSVPPGGRFEGAKMPYFLRLTGDGIGLHAGPIPRPGSRASHGCIRMPKGFAPILFDHVKIGTSATIVGDGPSYGTYLAQQQARNQARIARAPKPAAPADKGTPTAPTSTPEGSPAIAAATVTNTEATTSAPTDNTPATPPKAAASEATTAVAKADPATPLSKPAAEPATAPTPAKPEKNTATGEPAVAVAKTDPATPVSKPAAEPAPAAKGAPATAEKKPGTEAPAATGAAASPAEPPKAPVSGQAAAPATKTTPPEAPKATTSAASAAPASKDVPPAADKAPATMGAPAAKVTPAAAEKAPAAVSTPAPATPTAPTPPAKPAAAAPTAPAPAAPATPPPAPAMAGEKGKEATS